MRPIPKGLDTFYQVITSLFLRGLAIIAILYGVIFIVAWTIYFLNAWGFNL